MTHALATAQTHRLARPEDTLGYDVLGRGPLVVCLPGMGDLRQSYRFLVPELVAAGYRVATLDLRGHGESDTGFTRSDDVAAGGDLIALVQELGGPAFLVGSSMGAGAAVWAAAERPDLVTGLVLVGPFVRDLPMPRGLRAAIRLALLRPWGPAVWRRVHRRLFTSRVPADYPEYQGQLMASLRRPGAWRVFTRTTRTSHAPAEARLDDVAAPTLVVMGDADPDFPDPGAEARLVAERLGGEVVMVPGTGHYPHVESPDVVAPAVAGFLRRAALRG